MLDRVGGGTLLTGLGGDEILSGNEHHAVAAMLAGRRRPTRTALRLLAKRYVAPHRDRGRLAEPAHRALSLDASGDQGRVGGAGAGGRDPGPRLGCQAAPTGRLPVPLPAPGQGRSRPGGRRPAGGRRPPAARRRLRGRVGGPGRVRRAPLPHRDDAAVLRWPSTRGCPGTDDQGAVRRHLLDHRNHPGRRARSRSKRSPSSSTSRHCSTCGRRTGRRATPSCSPSTSWHCHASPRDPVGRPTH